jgi:hypothetical protein
MKKIENVTRQAILLNNCLDEHEKLKSCLDFGLVRSFLQSASGGGFFDNEILEFSSVMLTRDELLNLLDRADYSFVYFSGHSYFESRQVIIPLKNNDVISETEFILPNKKLWLFLDCCRTNKVAVNSPDIELLRKEYTFSKSSPENQVNWVSKISQMEPFYLIYYVTKLGGFAFSNAIGGYGTQLFFITLMEKLHHGAKVDFEQFIDQLNQTSMVLQESTYIAGNLDMKEFSSLY